MIFNYFFDARTRAPCPQGFANPQGEHYDSSTLRHNQGDRGNLQHPQGGQHDARTTFHPSNAPGHRAKQTQNRAPLRGGFQPPTHLQHGTPGGPGQAPGYPHCAYQQKSHQQYAQDGPLKPRHGKRPPAWQPNLDRPVGRNHPGKLDMSRFTNGHTQF